MSTAWLLSDVGGDEKAAGLPESVFLHTLRVTSITAYLENGGTTEHAQQDAAHDSPPSGEGTCRESGRRGAIEAFDRATRPPDLSDYPLDMGIRPESNTCSGGLGEVADGEVNVNLGNPRLFGQGNPSGRAQGLDMDRCPMYDAFISYSHADLEWVTAFVKRLRQKKNADGSDNQKIFFDVDSILVGENWIKKLETAIQESRFVIPIYSPDYFESKASGWELLQKFVIDMDASDRTILPCLIRECAIPPRLSHIQYLDMTERKSEYLRNWDYERLVRAINGADTAFHAGRPREVTSVPTIKGAELDVIFVPMYYVYI